MSEYWKSLPRKYCDLCKCWFADNKASIDFHERGKRHKENSQKRIQEIQKKGIKDYKKQQKLEDDMARIEQAALAAYQKDLKNKAEPLPMSKEELETTISNAREVVAPAPMPKQFPNFSNKKKKKGKFFGKKGAEKSESGDQTTEESTTVWYEGLSEDGQRYYYNYETSESSWEPPECGYITLEEQEAYSQAEEYEEESLSTETSTTQPEEEISAEKEDLKYYPEAISFGPQPKYNPYGQWVTVEPPKPVKHIDLQLPKQSDNIIEVSIPLPKEETRLKFKEKVIDHIPDADPSETVTFKKRKFASNNKKNVRQRLDDD